MNAFALKKASEFLRSWLAYRLEQTDISGLSVTISSGDTEVLSFVNGMADAGRRTRLTPTHLFNMASQTKPITAIAILQLVSRNKLGLDDYAVRYLPWLKEHTDKRMGQITIRQLLCHSSGLMRDGDATDFWDLQKPFPTLSEFREIILKSPLVLEPNTQLKYSNLGYALLGQIITKASGLNYRRYISSNILGPAGMTHSLTDYRRSTEERAVIGYGIQLKGRRSPLLPTFKTNALGAAVGLRSTTADMCQFAGALYFGNELLLSDELKREAMRCQWRIPDGADAGTEFGLGFEMYDVGGRRLVSHTGHMAGHTTATYFDPYAKVAVSVAANSRDCPSAEIAAGIFETLDFFDAAATKPAFKGLQRYSAHLVNNITSVQIVAVGSNLFAVDPDTWRPFAEVDKLEKVDRSTLRVVTPGSVFNDGELIHYKFKRQNVSEVGFAGYTLWPMDSYNWHLAHYLPQANYINMVNQTDNIRLGAVIDARPAKNAKYWKLRVDFGLAGTHALLLSDLPIALTAQQIKRKKVLSKVYSTRHFGRPEHHIVALGVLSEQAGEMLVDGLLVLLPDPSQPLVFAVEAAAACRVAITDLLANSQDVFKFEALSSYQPSQIAADLGEQSLINWLSGKRKTAKALLDQAAGQQPWWLSDKDQNYTHVRVVDDQTPYFLWEMELFKRVLMPHGETIYLLPKSRLKGLRLPQGDFTVAGNMGAVVTGYNGSDHTHIQIYNQNHSKNLGEIIDLRDNLIYLAQKYGQILTA